jgi:glucokinase
MASLRAPEVVTTGAGRDAAPGAVLGLDIGGTKIAAGVVDADGGVHGFVVAPTEVERGAEDGSRRLLELGRRAVEESGIAWSEIVGVGIGCGGPLDSANGILIAPLHLPGWEDLRIVDLATAAFDRPAVLDNDATACAAGEHRYGAGRGAQNMVYLTVSTGVGGGVVIDGRLHRGQSGNGGELGHVTVDWHGRRCRGCGRCGCLEAYASGTSIAERAHEAGLEDATAADVAAGARAGDPIATRIWDETCEALASGITSIANLFEPEVVVLGGGVVRAGEQLLAPVRAFVDEQVCGPRPKIVRTPLGDAVGVVGAAAVADERLVVPL